MKKNLHLLLSITIVILVQKQTRAQFSTNGGIQNRYVITQNPSLNNTIRRGGMGDFTDANSPAAAWHINANLLTAVIPTANNTFLPGEVFRTTATNANLNAWRLFTGAGQGTEKFSLFVPANSNNTGLQATRGDMFFNTGGTNERMRILGNNGFVGVNTNTPQNRMHIHDVANVYSQITNNASGQTANDGFWLGVSNLNAAELRQKENAPLNFFTNDTERLQIAANGDVIIKNPNGIILLANDNKTYYRLTITADGKIITELTQI